MGIHKIWSAGTNTLVITIDKTTQEALGLKEGDFVRIKDIEKIEPPKKEEDKKEDNSETEQKKIRFK